MDSVLSKLYDGDYFPAEHALVRNERTDELLARCSELEDELSLALNGALKDKFLEYAAVWAEYCRECGRDDFKEGFRLAVKMKMEGMQTNWGLSR